MKTITTPSGYKVSFKDQEELTYGDRRAIQKAMVGNMRLNSSSKTEGMNITGEAVFEGQEAALKIILKEIIRPDGNRVETNLFDEVMSWKKQEDGDAVFEVVNESMNPSEKKVNSPSEN